MKPNLKHFYKVIFEKSDNVKILKDKFYILAGQNKMFKTKYLF